MLELCKRVLVDIPSIIYRNAFLLVNGIIFAVVILLFSFGSIEAAVFLGAITAFNIVLGIVQDTRSRVALETLQMITALRVIRLNTDGSTESILMGDVRKGDHIDLKLGCQVPCDGVLLFVEGLEVSEALITGESESFPRGKGDKLSAGSIVTAGHGLLEARNTFRESRISKLTEEAKIYSANPSPIERSVYEVIKYAGYFALAVIVFVAVRGWILGEPPVKIVMNIGALASTIIPQGLVVITTFLFAFGAASYSKKHVLFQEINATEKLGRVKNLCMDKTGTLTDNILAVEKMHVREGVPETEVRTLASLYVRRSGDVSQTLEAIRKYLGSAVEESAGEVIDALPFSSWRQYGAVLVKNSVGAEAIIVGSTDVILQQISSTTEKAWLNEVIGQYAHTGKRIVCMARFSSRELPKELLNTHVSILAVFVFHSGFRHGVQDTIKFFQDRGVRIRIISGDNPDTVQSIAHTAGVNNTDTVVTGMEMQSWGEDDFDQKVRDHTIFARIVPEQKVKIIESLKKDGFTAMVGDGVNDALAVKKADLGIAMFDGAPATRHLASIILMNNSFNDLPGGVELADIFIRYMTILAGVFINSSLVGLLFFAIISLWGYAYPLMPLNITFINYFVVGIPVLLIGYWSFRPSTATHAANSEGFLKQIMPFVVWSSVIEAIGIAIVFALSPEPLKIASTNMLVLIGFIFSGFIFFALAPRVYRGKLSRAERLDLAGLAVFEVLLFWLVLKIPLVVYFFNLTTPLPAPIYIGQALIVLILCGAIQYAAMKRFFLKKNG